VREERLSWAIWALEYALLFRVQAARGGGPLLWLIGVGAAGCLLTFAPTLWRGRGGLSRVLRLYQRDLGDEAPAGPNETRRARTSRPRPG
jgi:hypothetical protein